MNDDLSRIRRYELKYTITEAMALAIRAYIQPIFSLDKHADPAVSGYTVNNLYLDTPDLRFYRDVKFRRTTRFKPRVRYYGHKPEVFAMLELKYKQNSIIWKTRRRIPLDQWPGVLSSQASTRTEPVIKTRPDTFEDAVQIYGAEPVLHVRYFREPWVSEIDDYGRVTFDRKLSCRSAMGAYELESADREMIYYDDPATTNHPDSPVILEIKTERFVPLWAIDIIRKFELRQRGFSKYCYVIDRSGEREGSMRSFAHSSGQREFWSR